MYLKKDSRSFFITLYTFIAMVLFSNGCLLKKLSIKTFLRNNLNWTISSSIQIIDNYCVNYIGKKKEIWHLNKSIQQLNMCRQHFIIQVPSSFATTHNLRRINSAKPEQHRYHFPKHIFLHLLFHATLTIITIITIIKISKINQSINKDQQKDKFNIIFVTIT